MNENAPALAEARRRGVRIEVADLGEWSRAQLNAEYDPQGPVIRVNARVVDRLAPAEAERFVALAVGHELYHHREQCGEVRVLADRAARERAADEFARALLQQ